MVFENDFEEEDDKSTSSYKSFSGSEDLIQN